MVVCSGQKFAWLILTVITVLKVSSHFTKKPLDFTSFHLAVWHSPNPPTFAPMSQQINLFRHACSIACFFSFFSNLSRLFHCSVIKVLLCCHSRQTALSLYLILCCLSRTFSLLFICFFAVRSCFLNPLVCDSLFILSPMLTVVNTFFQVFRIFYFIIN